MDTLVFFRGYLLVFGGVNPKPELYYYIHPVGGLNPFEKYKSKWIIFPNRGEHKKYSLVYIIPKPEFLGDLGGSLTKPQFREHFPTFSRGWTSFLVVLVRLVASLVDEDTTSIGLAGKQLAWCNDDFETKVGNEKKPRCLGFLGDEKLPSYVGIIS